MRNKRNSYGGAPRGGPPGGAYGGGSGGSYPGGRGGSYGGSSYPGGRGGSYPGSDRGGSYGGSSYGGAYSGPPGGSGGAYAGPPGGSGGAYAGPPGSSYPGGGGGSYPGGSGGGSVHGGHSESLSVILLLLTAGVGALMWLIGWGIYAANADSMSMPLLIGLEFGLLALAVGIVVLLVSISTGIFSENPLSGGSELSAAAMVLAGVILVAVLAGLFQWLYGLGSGRSAAESTSYVFIIDDSGSTENSDPEGKRYQAIPEVLSGMPDAFPYAVYSFSDEVYELRAMAPRSEGPSSFEPMNLGGTAIKTTLDAIIYAYETGGWSGGDTPRVIFMSDGYATDIGPLYGGLNEVLREYVKNGISISTVGLGAVDEGLMSKIAKSTGGVFVDVDDASQLSAAMSSAASSYSARDLLSTRYTTRLSFLYGLMRVVFLAILGTLIGAVAWIASGSESSMSLTLVSSGVKSLVGALVMELFSSLSGLSDRLLWLVLWVLIAATLALGPNVLGISRAKGKGYGGR